MPKGACRFRSIASGDPAVIEGRAPPQDVPQAPSRHGLTLFLLAFGSIMRQFVAGVPGSGHAVRRLLTGL